METASRRLDEATAAERGAAAALAELETSRERLRIELAEKDQATTGIRETAHRRELDIERRQQQIDFDKRRAAELAATLEGGGATLASLAGRRAPVADELAAQREAHGCCGTENRCRYGARGPDQSERSCSAP